MLRTHRTTLTFLVTGLSLALAVEGCALIAGIEDRGDGTRPAGAGGDGSSSSSGGMMSTSSSSGMMSTSSSSGGSSSSGAPSGMHSGLMCFDMAPVFTYPKCSGTACPATVMHEIPSVAYAVTTNGQAVYWAVTTDEGSPGHTEIYRMDIAATGTSPAQLVTAMDGKVYSMAADCKDLYFAIDGITGQPIKRVPLNAVNEATQQELGPGVTTEGVTAMAASDPFLFFATHTGNKVELRAWPMGGGPVSMVDSPNGAIHGIVVRDHRVYWIDEGGQVTPGQIRGADFPMPGNLLWEPQLIRVDAGTGQSLAVDESNVYWVDVGNSMSETMVYKAPNKLLSGGPLSRETMASFGKATTSDKPANWLSVDDHYLYVLDVTSGSGKVMRVNKGPAPYMPEEVLVSADFNVHGFVADNRRLYISAPSQSISHLLWVAK